jgi:hypothetical protein
MSAGEESESVPPPSVVAPPLSPAPASLPAAAPAPVPAPELAAGVRRCENCGSPLYGEHCFQCGQPTKGLVRHFSSILGDFFDTVFNIDSRVLRTIGPLLARPGFLSLEYFAGRRVRYVTPMRMFLFMSLVAFFAVQLAVDLGEGDGDKPGNGGIHLGAGGQDDSFDSAKTVAEVEKARDEVVTDLRKQRNDIPDVPGARAGMDVAITQIQAKADRRIAELKGEAIPGKVPAKPSPGHGYRDFNLRIFNDKPWDPVSNPLSIAWLPDALNHSLNRRIKHAVDVAKSDDAQASVGKALFNVLPQTLLVLMPIFALMLKLAYLFKRRLYMEHLIVALHSHAFIALEVTLMVALSWLESMLPKGSFLHGVLAFVFGLSVAWVPLYLLLMQKRVYGQGWPMTLAKFGVLGMCYSVLLGFALAGALIVGFLTL